MKSSVICSWQGRPSRNWRPYPQSTESQLNLVPPALPVAGVDAQKVQHKHCMIARQRRQALSAPVSVLHPHLAGTPPWTRQLQTAQGRSAPPRAPRSRPRTRPAAHRPPPAAAAAPHPSGPALQPATVGIFTGFAVLMDRVHLAAPSWHPSMLQYRVAFPQPA